MKTAIITDQHFGVRNDSTIFLDYYEKFYRDVFFPTLDSKGIKTLLILGDTFDRRKYVNFNSLQRTKKMFFDELSSRGIQVYMLIGNHDTFYKNTNDVNSPSLLLGEYDNLTMISEVQTLHLDYGDPDCDVLMVPWICADNFDRSITELANSKAKICMGHFEIAGFQMYLGAPAYDGMDQDMFGHFDYVFSGHFHHKSSSKNIHYLGNPYELTWQDYKDPRGFHIFDLKTRDLEFIKNPYGIFKKFIYDDKKYTKEEIDSFDVSKFKDTFVKIIVVNKTKQYTFDKFVERIYDVGVAEVSIVEDSVSFESSEDTDSVDKTEDTTTILNKFVDNTETNLDKNKLKDLLRGLYLEALNGVDE